MAGAGVAQDTEVQKEGQEEVTRCAGPLRVEQGLWNL